jgi:hypothetical protein
MPPTLSFLRHRYEICEAITKVEMESMKNFVTQWNNTTTPELASTKEEKKKQISTLNQHI